MDCAGVPDQSIESLEHAPPICVKLVKGTRARKHFKWPFSNSFQIDTTGKIEKSDKVLIGDLAALYWNEWIDRWLYHGHHKYMQALYTSQTFFNPEVLDVFEARLRRARVSQARRGLERGRR